MITTEEQDRFSSPRMTLDNNGNLQTPEDFDLVSVRDIEDDSLQKILDMYYPPGYNFEITKKEAKELMTKIGYVIFGDRSTIPMICNPDTCVRKETCPLVQSKVPPALMICPLEAMQLQAGYNKYASELEVDKDKSYVEHKQVISIMEFEILMDRCKADLAKNGLTVEKVTGTDNKGNPTISIDINPTYNIYYKLNQQKSLILKELVATRESRAKLQQKPNDPSKAAARRSQKIKEILVVASQDNDEFIEG